MTRGTQQRIADVLQAIDRCNRYLASLASEDRDLVDMAEDAVERNLQIIGEAVVHLPPEITDAHPEIAWPQIRGFRKYPRAPILRSGSRHCSGRDRVASACARSSARGHATD